jgi:hypothetical protein
MRLTDKGERWMLALMGYGSAAAIALTVLAAIGFAGWLQNH